MNCKFSETTFCMRITEFTLFYSDWCVVKTKIPKLLKPFPSVEIPWLSDKVKNGQLDWLEQIIFRIF